MKKGLHKFAKGIFAIFIIKLLIVSLIVLNQSCTNEEDNLDLSKDNFITSINDLIINFSKIDLLKNDKIDYDNLSYQEKNSENLINLNLTQVNSEKSIEFNNFSEVTVLISQGELLLDDNLEDCLGHSSFCVQVEENRIIETLNPAIVSARQYLNSKGLSDIDINEALEGKDESFLIPIVQAAIGSENQIIASSNNKNFNFLFGVQLTNAQDWNEIGRCAAVAVGADILYSLSAGGVTNWSKKALAKMIGKVALRFVGPTGVAVAVVTFGLCMNGWI